LSLLRTDKFLRGGGPFPPVVPSCAAGRSGFLLALAAFALSPVPAMAQNDAAEAEAAPSPEDERKLERALQLNEQAVQQYQTDNSREAEPILVEVLRLHREVMGANHPSTLTSLNNYAFVLNSLGRAKEAEPLFSEALRLRREVLGANHPDTR